MPGATQEHYLTSNRRAFRLNETVIVRVLLGLLILYVIVRGFAGAASTTFWYDEILTATVTALPSLKSIWTALASNLDGRPPAFYAVERAFRGMAKDQHIALRLLPILAFPCVLGCIFSYVRKRSGELIALLCAALVLSTVLFQRYQTEARPYGLVIACFAFALVCYQRVPSVWWVILLGFSLFLANSFHYFSVVAMLTFGLAETMYLVTSRRIRWRVWLALAVGGVPLLVFWPLLAGQRVYYGPHFWARYGLREIPSTYGSFFFIASGYGAGIAAVCITGMLILQFWRRPDSGTAESRSTELAEGTLLLSLIGLPLLAYIIVLIMHGGAMRAAYVLPALLAMILAIGRILGAMPRVGALLLAVFLLMNISTREFKFWESARSLSFVKPTEPFRKLLHSANYPDTRVPIVVASPFLYVGLTFYGPGPQGQRLFYLADEEKELRFIGSDSTGKNLDVLQKYLSLQIRDYEQFVSTHDHFLLYIGEPDVSDWIFQYSVQQGYRVQAVVIDPPCKLFLVTIDKSSP